MMHSNAKRVLFKYNDLEDLEAQYPTKIIAFESFYSMCGSVGPVKGDLAEQYGLDEVDLHF